MDKGTLLKFIAKAHRNTYAAPRNLRLQHRCKASLLKGHKDYSFTEGDFSYYDSYAGKLWPPGREVVFLKDNPVWCMSYQGQHNESYDDNFF